MKKVATEELPPQQQTRSRRESIIKAGLELLAKEGAHGLTHRSIDRMLGLPQGSTTNYFRSRNDLLVATGREVMGSDRVDAISVVIASCPDRTITVDHLTDRVVALFHLWLGPRRRTMRLARAEIWFEAMRNAELREAMLSDLERLVESFADIFAKLGSREPDRSSRYFFAMMAGVPFLILAEHVTATGSLQRAQIRGWVAGSLDPDESSNTARAFPQGSRVLFAPRS